MRLQVPVEKVYCFVPLLHEPLHDLLGDAQAPSLGPLQQFLVLVLGAVGVLAEEGVVEVAILEFGVIELEHGSRQNIIKSLQLDFLLGSFSPEGLPYRELPPQLVLLAKHCHPPRLHRCQVLSKLRYLLLKFILLLLHLLLCPSQSPYELHCFTPLAGHL